VKKIGAALLATLLIFCVCTPQAVSPAVTSSETTSSTFSQAIDMQDLGVSPNTVSQPFDDSFVRDLNEQETEELLAQLIYQYDNMIDATTVGTQQNVPYESALYYLCYYGGYHYYGNELEYDVRPQLRDEYYDYRYFKVTADVVENYLCGIFKTQVDRSALSDPTGADFENEYFSFIKQENCYLIHFRPSSFMTDVKIHSIQKTDDVYTVHADYFYVGDGSELTEPIYEQIFQIKLNRDGYRFLSVENLSVFSSDQSSVSS